MKNLPRGLLIISLAAVACDGGSSGPGDRDAGGRDAGVARDSGAGTDAGERVERDGGGGLDGSAGELVLPPANGSFDYQLGESYPPPSGVVVLTRDRSAAPAAGIYNICYVNGFQTQPDERSFWTSEHPDLLLRDGAGEPVIDPDWDEIILDVRTPEKRAALEEIVGAWIAGCAADGFDAVEIDNLDTYSRSGGLVTADQAVAFMALLSARAHAAGIAIAQKNSAEVLDRRAEMGTDFATVEECNRYSECGDFTAVYGDQVYVIEYRRADFDTGCADFPELSIVLRDLDLVGPGPGYVYEGC